MVARLTEDEIRRAAAEGTRRHINARLFGRVPKGGQPTASEPTWNDDIEGACSECAFAKLRGVPWQPLPVPDGPVGDVDGCHVRSTWRDDGSLIIQRDDLDEAVFVLMVGLRDRWRFAGWCYGHEGKIRKWWRTNVRYPAYFVPQHPALHEWPAPRVVVAQDSPWMDF